MRICENSRTMMNSRMSSAALLAGLTATALIVALLATTAAQRDRQAFDAAAHDAQIAIVGQVETSIALLRGTAGLFASEAASVTVASFHAYVSRLRLREEYPGILGIGFSRRLAPGERAAVEREMRAQGHAGFHLWPAGERTEVHSILFLEPLDARNRAAIGYDMYTNATRRAAMARARDSGRGAASGIVELVQEIDQRKQPGFLIYLPVYQSSDPIPASVEERRASLLGFAYSPIRAVDFLSSAFTSAPGVDLAVYHGTEPRASALLYEHAGGVEGARFRSTSTIDVRGQPWTFVFRSRTTVAQALVMPLAVALAGVALSLLLAVLVRRETRARLEAERANVMKDEFLATLSHELRTPLNAIVGWAAVLRQGKLSQEEVRAAIEVVDRNAKTQARLIEDLLDTNRIVSGKISLEIQIVDPAKVLDDALASVAPAADAKGVRMQAAVDSTPLAVHGDPARLQQIVWNLLSNAVKFTPGGGTVTARLEPAGSRLRLTVSDTGQGIDPRLLEHIFDRFAQADATTTRRHGGLGLGLAIVRHLVELHAGTVRAESAGPGKGATFIVELPLIAVQPPAPTALPGAVSPEAGLAGVKVLVVEDEADSRELMRVTLEASGAQVHCAANAREGLAALERERPHVLLSDIGMAGMDGYELLRQVRERPAQRGGRVPAAAITAFASEKDRREALEAGFQEHLVKPLDPAALRAVVARLARRAVV
jgi:signal transduction histidine kinase/ActR/RegA family two-component response regulator